MLVPPLPPASYAVAAAGGYAAARREATVARTVVNPTFKDAQWLSDHAGGEGMVVSCYADTSPSGIRPLWREHLKNEVKRIDETLSGDPAATRAFHRHIAAIEGVLSSRRTVSARGMAIFAASQRNLLQAYALASVVPNRLVIDEEPYLVPLLELLHRERRTAGATGKRAPILPIGMPRTAGRVGDHHVAQETAGAACRDLERD